LYARQIDRTPLWWDEGISVYFSQLPPVDLLRITAGDVHPPAYYLLLLAWMKVVGTHPFCVRLLSALCGCLLIPVLFVTGRRLYGNWTGIVAALCGTAAPFVHYYAREARMYSLGMLAAAVSAYAVLRLLEKSTSAPRWWTIYVASVVVGLHTQYAFVFVPAAHLVAVMAVPRRAPIVLRRWLSAAATSTALFVPWVLYSAWQLRFLVGYHIGRSDVGGMQVDVAQLLPAVRQLITGYSATGGGAAALAAVCALLLAALGAMVLAARRPDAAAFLGLSILGAVLLMTLLRRLPGEETLSRIVRQAFWGAPALWLLAAVGARRLFQFNRWAGGGVLLLLLGGLVQGLVAGYGTPIDARNDYRPLIAHVRAWAHAGDAALTTYYWQDGYFNSYAPELPLVFYRNYYSPETASALLEGVFASHLRVWVVNYRADVHDVSNPLNAWLARNAALAFEGWYGTSQLAMFVRPGPPPSAWSAQAVFADGIRLDYSPVRLSVAPGEALSVDLRWSAASRLENAYKVFVHLRQADQPPIAQSDSEPAGGFEPTSAWQPGQLVMDRRALLVPLDAPPGAYGIYVGLYDAATGGRLSLAAPSGGDTADSAFVGWVEIVPSTTQAGN
jgi:4-amino-4-deoxy-L-arabinose transferase-like glycosyltransferase